MTEKILKQPCPRCNRQTLFLITWDQIWRILKPRQWHICKSCNYEEEVGQIKKRLYHV